MNVNITKNTIGDVFDEVVRQREDAVYLTFQGNNYTYREMWEQTTQIAKGLIKMGVKPGDHVGIWLVNRPEWICFEFALFKIGAVVVTINTQFKDSELDYVIGQSDIVALIYSDSFRHNDYKGIINGLIPELSDSEPGKVSSARYPYLKSLISFGPSDQPGAYSFDDLCHMGEDVPDSVLEERQSQVDPEKCSLILYTSGTTGDPKGVMISQKSILFREKVYNKWFEFTVDDVVFCPTPLFYIFACVIGVIGTMRAGARLCLMETFESGEALRIISQEHCTVINCVPSMFIMMMSHPDFDKYDYSSCRTGVMGGSSMPVADAEAVIEKMVPQVASVYGLTESVTAASSTRPGDSPERVATTVGIAMTGCDIKVFDLQTGEIAPPGVEGELRILSDANMMGYYKMPEATAEAFGDDGWLRTGDLSTMDEEGYIKITGRIHDMYVTGGKNVYPPELENCIKNCPKVNQVQVVGVPDRVLGEVGAAYICLEPGTEATEEEIIQYCCEHLSKYKVPKYIAFVDSYPETATGKVQKFKLQEMAITDFGLD